MNITLMLQLKPDYFLKKERSSKLCLEDSVDLLQMHKPKSLNTATAKMKYILFDFFIQLILADTKYPTPNQHM